MSESERAAQNWTSFQLADQMLLNQLRATKSDWAEYKDETQRAAAWQRFKDYAYQWY